ncbi:porin [Vibrio mediterranei]|uniref:Porin n=1 Tax=Vibrio mediterranei TaxID=689 RepID=A0ABX5DGF6_9VIBR|nr:porin [Vibrio mediterranei]MCG9660008.1 porin [Vibrio mediterranei]MCG9663656.1 porin [Vibrio mediterranei]NOI26023.1 porin [Vibrio mediterranei]PCD85882.1 porin [Vibrio mediterranei]PRQ68818.1 porin [Vibrio mediterranei]
MNKTLLALAVTAAAIGTQANALEIYNKEGTQMSIGGHATIGLTGAYKGQDARVEQKSPRINLEVIQDIGHGFKADFKAEWAMNMLEGGKNTFTTRLGYIGLGHETYGRIAAGTQWSPYYMAAGVVDTPIGWSNDFLYDNHGFFGTARADKLAAYSNTVDFGDAGALTFGGGWQGANTVEDKNSTGTWLSSQNRAQVAAGYNIAGFNANYAFNSGNLTERGVARTAESHLVSGKYGNFGAGLYVAATYASNEYMNSYDNKLLKDTKAFDSILAYGLDFGLNLILKHEEMKDDELGLRVKSGTSVQAEYTISPRLRAYTGYNFDNQGEGKYKKAKDNQFIIGTRFYL